eukprot:TRINITY_DN6510_c0_g1_i2.p1 TRINITY_DN6510_c0_g1~~TRINITY_DN6510_c0_g1_i2.p1  ORF type:complete len:539 (+),score=120.31 TRINITY_DN6510_c0_g1_i2:199-1815(+)
MIMLMSRQLFYNGKIMMFEEDVMKFATWFYVKDGLFVEVGSSGVEEKYPYASRVDLGGKFVMSGFTDAHTHVYSLGESLNQVDLVTSTGVDDVVERIRKFIQDKEIPHGKWILGRGWDQNKWNGSDTPFPTRYDLDSFNNNPIILQRVDGHAIWVNSVAINSTTLPDQNPEGGKIMRDENGIPTGIFIDNAMGLITRLLPELSKEEIKETLKLGIDECSKYGLTSVHEAGLGPDVVDAIVELANEDSLNLRIYTMVMGETQDDLSYWCDKDKLDYYKDRVSTKAVKMFMDGALGSRGAALIADYSDDPGNYGILMKNQTEFDSYTKGWAQCGYQLCTHAIGDRANQVVLNAYEKLFEIGLMNNESRYRIEHAQIIDTDDFVRFSEYNILASVQPTHATSDMLYAEDRLGPERIKNAYAWRTFLNNGVHLPLGSDFPVEYVDPLLGVYAATTRKNTKGLPEGGWYPEEKLTMEETLYGFTVAPAYASFSEDKIGNIKAGMYADFIVLSDDLSQVTEQAILSVKVEKTYLGGDIIYSRSQ